ncbi:MFS transporter [Roseiterribacter gracilis]|uniref:MFS transporter n=1 Tax=Roseiterribacter gracilis TaxID=2812848 RepID=A0A8S8X8D0_9PROT|nr:MFS transporter [Rhodospirillales bacterium TMPK1]
MKSGWTVAFLLMATQLVSYIDRFLPSLVLDQFRTELALTNAQVGMLFGIAFALFYAIMGLPFGWLADRLPRKYILSSCIALWCVMTMLGGVAHSYTLLFLSRMGVGLGEAAVNPSALGLIGDYFKGARRARAVGLFMCGTFGGAGLCYLLGSRLVHFISEWAPASGIELAPWRICFLLIGFPGLVLAILWLFMPEPPRDKSRGYVSLDSAGLVRTLRFVAQNWKAFGTLFIGSGATLTLGSLAFWNITLFRQEFGWSVVEVGTAVGFLFFLGGGGGTALSVWLSSRFLRAGKQDASMRVLWIGLAIGVPSFALYPQMASGNQAVGTLFFAFLAQGIAAAAGPAALTFIAPGQIRAQATAFYFLVINLCGQAMGAWVVGELADRLPKPHGLANAMTIEAFAVGIPALLLILLGLRHYRQLAATLTSAGAVTPGSGH